MAGLFDGRSFFASICSTTCLRLYSHMGVIVASTSALQAFWWPMVKFIFGQNHYKPNYLVLNTQKANNVSPLPG